MANARSGNTFFVDTAGDLTTIGTRVYYIIISATNNGAVLVLQDATSHVNVLRLSAVNDKDSHIFDFSARPLFFPGGIEVDTITNMNATIVAEER